MSDEIFKAEFMAWWEEHGQYCRTGGGDYERTFAFEAWRHLYPKLLQARATLSPAHIEDGEEVEVVGYRSGTSGGIYTEGYGLERPEPLMTVAQHQRIVAARASKAAACVENEREEFDCWFRREEGLPESADTTNISAAYLPWKAWKARAALSAPPAAGTTSDQYRAELYDEVWQKARDMGYGNVTDALVELERIKAAPPASVVPEGWKLVPIKPTDDMVVAFAEQWYSKKQVYDDPDMDDAYASMLSAAPTPPASEQQNRCPHDSWRYGGGPCSDCGEVQFSEEELLRLNRPASEQQRAVVMPEGKLLVSAEPLRKVLFALLGAPHHIRELQATRTPTDLFADNPINVLIAELNAAQGGDA